MKQIRRAVALSIIIVPMLGCATRIEQSPRAEAGNDRMHSVAHVAECKRISSNPPPDSPRVGQRCSITHQQADSGATLESVFTYDSASFTLTDEVAHVLRRYDSTLHLVEYSEMHPDGGGGRDVVASRARFESRTNCDGRLESISVVSESAGATVIKLTYSYDAQGRLTLTWLEWTEGAPSRRASSSARASRSYSSDGKLRTVEYSAPRNVIGDVTRKMNITYDASGRLSQRLHYRSASSSPSMVDAWTYRPDGTLETLTRTGSTDDVRAPARTWTYSPDCTDFLPRFPQLARMPGELPWQPDPFDR